MFTGLIQALGTLQAREQDVSGDLRMRFATPAGFMDDVQPGDSIAINGVCLTALMPNEQGFCADVSLETARLTTLAAQPLGASINLEKSLRAQDRLGGHFVSGHVDAMGSVRAISPEARSQRWEFSAPRTLAKLIASKGSIAINGVSLTVNHVHDAPDAVLFAVNLIPHTLTHTSFGALGIGAAVNVEVDVLARYVQRQSELADERNS
jgi:riboflavin synthase